MEFKWFGRGNKTVKKVEGSWRPWKKQGGRRGVRHHLNDNVKKVGNGKGERKKTVFGKNGVKRGSTSANRKNGKGGGAPSNWEDDQKLGGGGCFLRKKWKKVTFQ